MSVLGKLLAFWGEEKASCDSASGNCSMQPCSWLLLTGPGWSKFTSKSSITDFLQNYFFFRKMWLEQDHNFLLKALLSQTLDGRCSYIRDHLARKGDLTGLMFRVLSWATGEWSALSPWHPWPGTAAKVCLLQLPAWWRSGITWALTVLSLWFL